MLFVFSCITIKETLQTLQTLDVFYPWIPMIQDCTFCRLCRGKRSFEESSSGKNGPEARDEKNAVLMSTRDTSHPSLRTSFCPNNNKRHNKMATIFSELDNYTTLTRLLPELRRSVNWTFLKIPKISWTLPGSKTCWEVGVKHAKTWEILRRRLLQEIN